MTTETFNRLENALQLNNKGVSQLLQKKDAEAIGCLRESLTIFQQILVEYDTDNENNNQNTYSSLSRTESNKMKKRKLTAEKSKDCEDYSPQAIEGVNSVIDDTVSIPSLQHECCFMYNKAIRFNIMGIFSSQPQTTSQDVHMFIATVILNLALAYHRKISLGNLQHVDRAKKMYETVSRLLVGKNFDIRHQGLALLLSLASTNNLSLICYEEGYYDTSMEGFQYLALLLGMQHNYNISIICGDCYNELVSGMSLNVIFGNARPSAAGAA